MSTEANEPWALDKMDRRGVAKFLTQYLDSDDTIKVLNINAPWGTGKTFFLENWKAFEQKNMRACVYFNAWETDFSGDAFISMVASIRDQLADVIGTPQKTEDILKKFTAKAAQTLIAATPAITKGVVKKLTSIDIDVVSSFIDQEGLTDAAEKAVGKLIESNKETLNTVHEFKIVFSRLLTLAAATCAAGEDLKPVYIYIDELDRCRPTFAIELLERIKHLFGVDQCKFIIATDTNQLGEAIRAVYGAGFNSEKYLRRFFDREFTLSAGNYDNWVKANCNGYDSSSMFELKMIKTLPSGNRMPILRHGEHLIPPRNDVEFIRNGDLNEPQLVIIALAKTFNSSLRDLSKINCHIKAIQANIEGPGFHFFWAAYLVFLKVEAPTLYGKLMGQSLASDTAELDSKFPPRSFHFYQNNLTVHELFFSYLRLYKSDPEEVINTLKENEHLPKYFMSATVDFANDHRKMSLYPKLVDLAHSIE